MEENANKQIERTITELLNEMNFKHSSLGFCYWLKAISYSVEKCKLNGKLNKVAIANIKMEAIYKEIAEYYETTRRRAEKAMRYSVQESKYSKVFSKQHISNKEFLILCIEKICSNQ